MTQIKHAKVSAVPDGTDTSQVRPSDWNDEHDVAIDAGDVAIADAGSHFTATDVEGALQELGAAGGLSAHLADTTDAHDASAISFDPSGLAVIAGTDVQTALEELDAAVDAGGGGAGLLASVQYNLGGTTQTSAAAADIDATNFKVTFTAPASGAVLVTVNVEIVNGAGGGGVALAVREGSSTVGALAHCLFASSQVTVRVSCSWKITGLTPGNSYTYKGAYGSDGFNTGGVTGQPGTMTVVAA